MKSWLVTEIAEMSATVSEHTARLDTIDDNWRRHEQELRDLRELYCAAPRPELKINGIPLSCTELVQNLFDKLLGLLALKSEVKIMRLLVPKITDTGPAQHPQDANRHPPPPTNSFTIGIDSVHGILRF